MTLRRQSFRLRIPWPFASSGRPSTEPLRPKDGSKSPPHADTNVPIQRPTSPPKPLVTTPVEFPPSPTKTKEAPSAEPQKQSPPHPTQPTTTSVVIESSVPSQSTTSTPFHSPQPSQSKTSTPFHSPLPSFQSSSRADSPSRVSIVSSSPKTPPKSPSHLAFDGIIEVAKPASEESTWPTLSAFEQEKEKKVVPEPISQEAEPKVSSPLKAITKSPETSFQPKRMSVQPQDSEQQASSMPSTQVSKTKPASAQPPPPSSPLAAEHIGKLLKSNAEESTSPTSLASQEEKEKMVEAVSKPVPQEAEPKVKSPLKTIPMSPKTSFQHERMSTHPQGFEQQAFPVPSSPVSKIEPASDRPPPSSPLVSEHISKVLKPSAEESTSPPSLASQEEREKMAVTMSGPMPQEAESKIKSPLKTIPKSPEALFQDERISTQPQDTEQQTSSMVSKTKPASDQPPHPSSPLASERTSEVLKPKIEESTLPTLSASQEEKEKTALAVSEPVPQEAKQKMKSPLKTIPKSPETSSKPENLYTQPTPIIGDVERSAIPETKKLDLDSAARSSKAPLQTQSKLLEPEDKEKEMHEPIKARKAKDITTGQPSRRTIASTSRTTTKDPFIKPFRADRRRHGGRETTKRKMMFATSKPSEKDIRFVSSADPGTRDLASISPEKAPLHKGIKDDVSKFVHTIATVDPTQPVDDKQFSVITLAGDNRGATIQVGSESAMEDESVHIRQAYKADPEESTEVSTDVEERTKTDSEGLTKHDVVGKAYVNSNIQSINNSLMVHGSVTETDTGVQVSIPQDLAEPISPLDKRDLETHKVEFNISRDERS